MIVRQLFTRLVFSLHFESSLSMEIISFWLWLEGIGHADFLASIDSLDNHRLHSIASAAKIFVEALRLRSSQSNPRSVEGGYFRKEAVKGIVFYLNNVCYRILQDILEAATAKEHVYRHANQAQQQYVKGKAPMTMSTVRVYTTVDLQVWHTLEKVFHLIDFPDHSCMQKDLLSKIKASLTSARSHVEGSSSRSIMVPSPKTHILKDIENPIEQCLSSTYPLASLFESLNIREIEEEEEPTDAVRINAAKFLLSWSTQYLSCCFNLLMSPNTFLFQMLCDIFLLQIQIQQQPIVPRDERTLFVTFSNGYPFTADELYEFFFG